MESPGEYLKRERELRGISVEKVSEGLKISVKILKSLEADKFDALPHEAYVKGFIKSYARFLELDDHDAVLRYEAYLREKAESEEQKKKKEERLNTGFAEQQEKIGRAPAVSRPNMPDAMTLVPVFILAVVLVLAVYVIFWGGEGNKVKEAAVKMPSAVSVETAAPKAMEEQTIKPKAEESVKKAEPIVPAAKPSPVKAVAVTPAPVVTPVPEKKTVEKPLVQPAGEAARPAHTLVITAKEDVWVKVEADSKAPFEMLMREGDKKKVEATVFF